LPLIAANELVHGSVMLTNMPNIVDTNNLQTIANEARTISKDFYDLTSELCSKIRASILLIPVGIHHFGMTKFFGVG
jgi:UDP-N-acetylglucosamine enolpyruvyl transferase